MKRLAAIFFAAALLAGSGAVFAQCVATQSSRCDKTFTNPACVMQSGSTCYRDAVQCLTSCAKTGGWDDCEERPNRCISYQW